MIRVVDYDFGPAARNRLDDTATPGIAGAVAALETFYYALNGADLPVLSALWFRHDLTQLHSPLGGTIRSTAAIVDSYRRSFASGMQLQLTFTDAATYDLATAVVFAGREHGTYRRNDGRRVTLDIRTSRLFGWDESRARWAQLLHHGSIDDPFELADYQATARA
ncbi:MAG TPA: nuclear transport factor 2 family protein [Jatrophihabitans sp.]|nr:nuclear transport factor 2 family protein [Jatrophihabitans sp.]